MPLPIVACEDLLLDARLARFTGRDGVERRVYPRCAKLLHLFMSHPNQLITHQRCYSAIWPDPKDEPEHPYRVVIDTTVLIRRLLYECDSYARLVSSRDEGWTLLATPVVIRVLTYDQAKIVDAMIAEGKL